MLESANLEAVDMICGVVFVPGGIDAIVVTACGDDEGSNEKPFLLFTPLRGADRAQERS